MLGHQAGNNLGEALRDLGRFDEARQAYTSALEGAWELPLPVVAYVEGNVALVDAQQGHFARARLRVERVMAGLGGDRSLRVWVYLALVLQVCLAADGDQLRWCEQLEQLEQVDRAQRSRVVDAPALLHMSARIWTEQGQPQMAERALELVL